MRFEANAWRGKNETGSLEGLACAPFLWARRLRLETRPWAHRPREAWRQSRSCKGMLGHNGANRFLMTNDFDHRDAAFEEILHLIHDMGIGVDGSNSISNPALPEYQAEIRAAQINAIYKNNDGSEIPKDTQHTTIT